MHGQHWILVIVIVSIVVSGVLACLIVTASAAIRQRRPCPPHPAWIPPVIQDRDPMIQERAPRPVDDDPRVEISLASAVSIRRIKVNQGAVRRQLPLPAPETTPMPTLRTTLPYPFARRRPVPAGPRDVRVRFSSATTLVYRPPQHPAHQRSG